MQNEEITVRSTNPPNGVTKHYCKEHIRVTMTEQDLLLELKLTRRSGVASVSWCAPEGCVEVEHEE